MESAAADRMPDTAMGSLGRSTIADEKTHDQPQGEGVYAFVTISDPDGISLFSIVTSDGSRAVVLFDEPLAAEAFVFLEELGEGWEVVEHSASDTATLLDACSLSDVDYVALNPPSSASRVGWELRLVRIADFAANLRLLKKRRV